MSVARALRSAGSLLRRHANALLPYYALRAAAADVARLPLFFGVVVAYVVLSARGRLRPVVDEFAATNPELLSPEGPAGLPAAASQRLVDSVASPAVVGPLLVAVGVAVVCYVVARAVARAASLAAVTGGFREEPPLAAGVDGIGRWRTFAGLIVVRWGLLLVAAVPLVVAVGSGVAALGTTPAAAERALDHGAVLAVLAAVAGALVTVGAALVVLALLAFAGPAAIVEGVGIRTAVRRSVGVPFAQPTGFVGYLVVVVASYLVLGVCAVIFGVAGVGRLVALASTFLLAPVLDSLAVGLYLGWSDDESRERSADRLGGETGAFASRTSDDGHAAGAEHGVEGRTVDEKASTMRTPSNTTATVRSRLRGTFGAGLRELAGFLRHDWGYVVVAAAVLVAGIVGGWRATAGYGVRIPAPADPAMVFGAVPLGPFVTIAVNNWLVATSAGFSGLFAGAPTVGTLLFNGVLIGAVGGVVDPVAFVALVAPHGVVELPAIAVAGGVGLRLGHVAWNAWRGQLPTAALVDEIGRTWRLVVGLAVVFVVAGFVEAFVTPQVAAAVLG